MRRLRLRVNPQKTRIFRVPEESFGSTQGCLPGTLLKHTLDDRYCGKNVRPTGIEGQLCEHLRGLRFRQAVIHRPIQVIGDRDA
jgi:hypothetical protein